MKKVFIGVGALMALFIAALVMLITVDFNRLNKDEFYIQITDDGELEETKVDSGKIFTTYWYEVPAYNVAGDEETLKFSASKNLRHEAYLKLYVKKGNEVTSYDEVQFEDIPEKAKNQLKH